jgi:molybdenum transport protein
MVIIPDSTIDAFICEDIPYFDLTTSVLEIGDAAGTIEFYSRDAAVLCGTEEVRRIFEKFSIITEHFTPSGTHIGKSEIFVRGRGRAESIHHAWKVSLNILEFTSGIATKTHQLIRKAKEVNPSVEILTTRKSFPGTKLLVTKAIMAGGALPHRLGISETILVFAEHRVFTGGTGGFLTKIDAIRNRNPEKKIIVEVDEIEDACLLARAGVDGIQFDKIQPEKLASFVSEIRSVNKNIVILAAGGITVENVSDFAKSGVDGLVTSSLFHAKPADMGVKIVSV